MPTSSMLRMILLLAILLSVKDTKAKIGINWGRRTRGILIPSMVVDMLLQNNISEVKLFNINDDLIRAFQGTNISLTIVVPKLGSITTLDIAKAWVLEKIAPFQQVNIRYVLVANNGFGGARFNKIPVAIVVRSLELMQNALDILGYGNQVKVVITHSLSGTLVLNSTRPSDATFLPDIMEPMLEVLDFINRTNTPFIFDFFPTGYVDLYDVDTNFAFFDNKSTYSITDINGLRYHNALDAVYDMFLWALKKVGYDNIKITCGQIGWPTDGLRESSVQSAERFWKGLLPKVMSKSGTPMRPGIEIDIFIHSLVDEKRIPKPINPFVRHWGIFRFNGEPEYKIDLMGQGRDIYPTKLMGITTMPRRWCIFNGNNLDPVKMKEQYDVACELADCTTLTEGSSCGMLSPDEKLAYAFNGYFQTTFQDEEACVFDGLGTVTLQDPSTDTCVFPIGIVRGNKAADPVTRWDNVGAGPNPYL